MADDYERLMRSRVQAVEADAQFRARDDDRDRARVKSQKIVDSVTSHTSTVLRDAEDQARQLRWQQQLASFMAEVRELIRPDGIFSDEAPTLGTVATAADDTDADGTDATDEPASELCGDEALDDGLLDDDAETIDGRITIKVVESDEKASR